MERYSPPSFFSYFLSSSMDYDPGTIRKAVDSNKNELWNKAMVKKMEALDKNWAWDSVKLSTKNKLDGSNWVFENKFNIKCEVEKYKTHLLFKGFSQVEGIDFGEIFLLLLS